MFLRNIIVRAAWLPTLAVTLLIIPAILADSQRDRVRLDAQSLASSRGANPNVVLTVTSCNWYQSNWTCTVVNDPCTTCSTPGYTDLKMGANGGYTQNPPTNQCGTNSAGKCDAALNCTLPSPTGWCKWPPKAAVQ